MNFEKLDQLEKYFKDKFKEPLPRISENSKSAQNIVDLEGKIISVEEKKETFTLTKPKRNTSIFDKKCAHCGRGILKNIDLTTYYKHNYCYECFVQHEES